MPMDARPTQIEIRDALRRIFPPSLVLSEWAVGKGATNSFRDRTSYLPCLDIAVGPFNSTAEFASRDAEEIRRAAAHRFISRLVEHARMSSDGRFVENPNPRCLLAVEIEFSGTSKHILGDYTNASMMGYVGAVVGPAQRRCSTAREKSFMKKIERVGRYAKKLGEVGKSATPLFSNVVALEEDELMRLLAA